MEKYDKGNIADVSWRDGISQDQYYWLSNSFQYSENLNTDDELHWIKLSQKAESANVCANCQLISAWANIFALPLNWWKLKYFNKNNWTSPTNTSVTVPSNTYLNWAWNGTVFQDYFWFGLNVRGSGWQWSDTGSGLVRINVTGSGSAWTWIPRDHSDYTDESISNPSTITTQMGTWISAILNYNNTRLVVWVWQYLRVYYPELDTTNDGRTWWKIVQSFENWCNIIALTCTFEYLKVRVTDEWWNTKIYYYQGNDDLRNTFVYNLVDLTNTKVLRVYPINWIDYFTASLDWTDGFITFNKIIGSQAVQLFKQRPWLTKYDVNQKATYFVWPTSHNASYLDWAFYVADSFWVFKFKYDPTWYDKGYLKWKINWTTTPTPWLAICENFLYTSDANGLHRMRLYDTWVDWYQSKWILISREMEGSQWWCVAKMLDEVRCHFELNPMLSSSQNAWDIDIYVSPNNMWKNVDPTYDSTWWYHVIHIDGASGSQNRISRFEKTNQLNNVNWTPAFEFDWETITYCVVITKNDSNAKRTPIVREVNMIYHTKWKTNNIYDIK